MNKITLEEKLTDRQEDILKFINDFINTNGFPPSYREIGNHFGIASTFGVKRHLDALVKKGFLTIDSKTNRSISLTEEAELLFNTIKENNSVEIPILGRVAAGYPVLSEQNIEGTLFIDSSLIRKGSDYFGLKVRGDSMIDAGILDGDLIAVRKSQTANVGEIVVARIEDEVTVKRLEMQGANAVLQPANDFYQPIVLPAEDLAIEGLFVGLIRA